VPLAASAPKPRTKDFTEVQKGKYRCTFNQNHGPTLTVTHLAGAPLGFVDGRTEILIPSGPTGFKPLVVVSEGSSITLQWPNGRFEFLALEGDVCCAIVRAVGLPAEVIALHLTGSAATARLYRLPLFQPLTYMTKVARVLPCGTVRLFAFEPGCLRAVELSPDGALSLGRVVLEEACAAFVGFTDAALVVRTRSRLHLIPVHDADGATPSTLLFTRLGVSGVVAASYHHPTRRLVAYDGGGTLLEYPLLGPPAPPAADGDSDPRPTFAIFQGRSALSRPQSIGAMGSQSSTQVAVSSNAVRPPHSYRFST
jgi:hypothetical protein